MMTLNLNDLSIWPKAGIVEEGASFVEKGAGLLEKNVGVRSIVTQVVT